MAQAENAKKLDYTPVTYDDQYILMVNQLKKYFPIKGGLMSHTVGHVKAVDGVTFNLKRGHTMGLVGESGCGKSTTGRTILRLAGEKTGGQVLFNGKEVYDMTGRELRNLRTKMQIIFQDPFSSLSPRLPVGEIIGEAVREHNLENVPFPKKMRGKAFALPRSVKNSVRGGNGGDVGVTFDDGGLFAAQTRNNFVAIHQ